ncbi:ribonuclease Z [Bradyrhizobium lablabi]|uniref:Ribonuclease Z n=1 Tax=Bradyrhizobium lablabi TaxID=722472 RepID=A0A0R3MZQ3_9BRAD|nr:MBL fold metallo-hydrolase [Bradyrhizobium lablabi]KRR23647.1 ribonuclease Z [Bradyrhizobium lablabi]
MDVILLGTGTPMPHPDRAGPATLVKAGGSNILIDCGRAVVMRLAASGVGPQAISAVLITHMHSDHISDLNDVITTHWVMNPGPARLQVFGPPGIRGVVDATLAMLALDIGYRIAHHADLNAPPDVVVTELSPGTGFSVSDCHVTAHATEHAPAAPSLGYRISHDGAVAAIAGDTIPCKGLDELCLGADVYVQATIRDDLVKRVPSRRLQDILDYHSTAEQAAQTAQRAGVKTLMLTHYVPPLQPGQEEEWLIRMRPHFSGEIVLGNDLTSVSVTAKPR